MASVGGLGSGPRGPTPSDIAFERRNRDATRPGSPGPAEVNEPAARVRFGEMSVAGQQLLETLADDRANPVRSSNEARLPSPAAAEMPMPAAHALITGSDPTPDRAGQSGIDVSQFAQRIDSPITSAPVEDRLALARIENRSASARIDDRFASAGAAQRVQGRRDDEDLAGVQRVDDARSAAARAADPALALRAGRREGVPRALVAVPAADNLRSRVSIEMARSSDTMTAAAARRAMREYDAG